MLGVDRSFKAHNGAVLTLARATQNSLSAFVCKAAGADNVARVLLASHVVRKGDGV